MKVMQTMNSQVLAVHFVGVKFFMTVNSRQLVWSAHVLRGIPSAIRASVETRKIFKREAIIGL